MVAGWVVCLALVGGQPESVDLRLARAFTVAVREANRNPTQYARQITAAQAALVAYHMAAPAERTNIARSMWTIGARAQSLQPAKAEGHVWAVMGAGYYSLLNGHFTTVHGAARYREAAQAAIELAADNRHLQALMLTHQAELQSQPEAGVFYDLAGAYHTIRQAEERYAQGPLTVYLHAELALRQNIDSEASLALRRFSKLAPMTAWERQLLIALIPGARMLEASVQLPLTADAN